MKTQDKLIIFWLILILTLLLVSTKCNGQVFHSNKQVLFSDDQEIESIDLSTTIEFSKSEMRMILFFAYPEIKIVYKDVIYTDTYNGFEVITHDALFKFILDDYKEITTIIEYPIGGLVNRRVWMKEEHYKKL